MIRLDYLPKGRRDLVDYYGGEPAHLVNGRLQRDNPWYKKNVLEGAKLPYYLRIADDPSQRAYSIKVHKKVADSLLDALKEIGDWGGVDWLREHDLDFYSGVYSLRWAKNSEGVKQLSTHCWAIAIDLVPNYGPYDEPSRVPWFICEAFLRRGWVNLPKHDGMHWQATSLDY